MRIPNGEEATGQNGFVPSEMARRVESDDDEEKLNSKASKSHDESSSSSSNSRSSSNSSSTSSKNSHHHHHEEDDETQAHGEEEEVVSKNGAHEQIVEEEIVEEPTINGDVGSLSPESGGDGALEVPSWDSTQASEEKKYHVVRSETLEGDDPVETSAPEETVGEIAESAAEENAAKDMIDEAPVEKRELSDVVVAESEKESHGKEEEHAGFVPSEKSVLAETEEVQNGNAQEVVSTENSRESEGKREHDERFNGEMKSEEELQALRNQGDLTVVEVASPLELKNRLLNPLFTPSSPRRENSSVYKIVMALEGLQIGEKCIHGEIDHGVCHQRYGDKKPASPSFSPLARRDSSCDSSMSPKVGDWAGEGDASPSPSSEVRVSGGEKREVDNEWSFLNSTTELRSVTKTETYTDTVLFRRDEGFQPRTPGRSPLSGSQSMRAVFSQAEASGSATTPVLKIVHEFPAEQVGASSTATIIEGESEVERILRLQETHDLVCPVCRSCITKRVILRKRKRTTTVSSIEKWETEVHDDGEESSGEQVLDINAGDTVVEEYENYGCLSCFTFLFRRERSTQRTEVVEVQRAPEVAAASPVATPVPDSVAALPPAPTAEDYDNRCLPIFFTWRRKTISSTVPEIVAPLLSEEERAEDSSVEVVRTASQDVSAEDPIQQISAPESKEILAPGSKEISALESKEILAPGSKEISASGIQQASTSDIQQRSDAETLKLPAAPGVPEGVQIPVVVVESREDRLCFPFLWRRATKSTQAHPELLQPLLAKEAVKQHSEDVEQQSTVEHEPTEIKTENFSSIEDDLWMRREVPLEVPVSVPPAEEPRTPDSSSRTPDASEISATPETSVTTRRVTEEERRVDCLCFPSWSSTETTTEETETSQITNSQQGGLPTSASASEATEKLQTSTSQEVITSIDLRKAVTTAIAGTEGSEITLSSPSFKGAVLPVASGTQDTEAQKASLNCMEILIPSYPWGPPGTGRIKEATEKREEATGRATSSSAFEFNTVGQVDSKGSLVLPVQAVAESSKQPGLQPNQLPAEIVLAQTTERREDSTCFPLSLPTLSWRRQELIISGEIVDGSSKTKAAEVKSSATSEPKSPVSSERKPLLSSEYKSPVFSENKSSVSSEYKSPVSLENKSPVSSEPNPLFSSEPKSPVSSERKPLLSSEPKSPVSSEHKPLLSSEYKSPVSSVNKSSVSSEYKSPVSLENKSPVSSEPNLLFSSEPKSPVSSEHKPLLSLEYKSPVSSEHKPLLSSEYKSPVSSVNKSSVSSEYKSPVSLENKSPVSSEPNPLFSSEPKSPVSSERKPLLSSEPKSPVSSEHKPLLSSEYKSPVFSEHKSSVSSEYKSPVSLENKSPVSSEPNLLFSSEPKSPVSSEHKPLLSLEYKSPVSSEHKPLLSSEYKSPVSSVNKSSVSSEYKSPVSLENKSPVSSEPKPSLSSEPKPSLSSEYKSPVSSESKSSLSSENRSPVSSQNKSPVSSVTETTEKLQSSTSQGVITSIDLRKAVTTAIAGTEGSEITLSSPSFKGAVLPVASGTQDTEAQKASLNCMEILIPSYPWGPPGTGRIKEATEKREEATGRATSSSAFEFNTVGQVDSKGSLVLPVQAVAESSKQPGLQPNQLPAEIVLAQTTERREDSTCFPLSLPTLSWRRQELIISGEIVDGSSKTKAAEVKSSATSEPKSPVSSEHKPLLSSEYKSPVFSENKSSVSSEYKSPVSLENKSPVSSEPNPLFSSEPKSPVSSARKPLLSSEYKSPVSSEHKPLLSSEYKSPVSSVNKSSVSSEYKSPVSLENKSPVSSEPKPSLSSEPKPSLSSEYKSPVSSESKSSLSSENRSPVSSQNKSPVSSVTETTEKLQSSTSQGVITSIDLRKAVTTAIAGTEGSEITLSSPSFKGAVLPVASGTQDTEAQKASLNCMEILIPSYPWGPPGTGRIKELTEKREEHTGSAATSSSFEFNMVSQVDSKGSLVLPVQAVAESSKQPGLQPNQSPAEIVLAQTTERREDSTCFPLSLPTLSWRRQELIISGEIVDGSSKSRAAEVKLPATSESKLSVASENKPLVTLETKSLVSSEPKSSVRSESKSSMALESKSSVDSESRSFGTAGTVLPLGKVIEQDFTFGDIEVSRNQILQREQDYNDSAVELGDEEEEPLVRKPPASKKLTPSKVEPLLLEPVEVNERVIVSVEADDSSLPEALERDFSFSQNLTGTEIVPTALPIDGTPHEAETREKGSWNCCLPSYSQLAYQPIEGSDIADRVTATQAAVPASSDALSGASISDVSDTKKSTFHDQDSRETTIEEELREKRSWNSCWPSYSQLSYQPIEDGVTAEQAAPASSSPAAAPASSDALPGASISQVSDRKEAGFHEEVTRETTVDARITTQEIITKSSMDESIDSVRVNTTVSYVHGNVQHDNGDAEGTLVLDDHPTLTFHPADTVSDLEDSKTYTQPPLAPMYSTGYAALSRFLQDEEEDAGVKEIKLADLSRQDVGRKEILLPSEAVTEVEQEGIQKSESVAKTEQDIGEELKLVPTVPGLVISSDSAQQDISREQERDGSRAQILEEDGSCCGPSSKWFWGKRKYTTEEAQLREPLLGRDSAQIVESNALQRDSEADSQDSSARVTIEQTHEVTETRMGDRVVAAEEERCQCFPWSGRDLTESVTGTTVTVTADDTVIEVAGTDATSTIAAATRAAEDAGLMDEPLLEGSFLKSIVYGGLDVSLTSLGVVAAAAGGDAKTRNILALGLSNLIFGFLTFFYKLQDLHKERPVRFRESVGPRFWINGPLAMLSFLVFGALPVLTFAFSFRELNDHDYKMAATVLASTIAIIFLGCGKVAAKMTELSYRRTVTTLITTGILASVAGYYTGEYISKLLKKYGILDE